MILSRTSNRLGLPSRLLLTSTSESAAQVVNPWGNGARGEGEPGADLGLPW